MTDKQFLMWIYERLKNVHGEEDYHEHMERLRVIAENMKTRKRTKV